MVVRYLAGLTRGRTILWCYLLWYLVVLVQYFDPNPLLWLTSLGLSFIIGYALYISTISSPNAVKLGFWPIFRLFLMPFCVSSFAALVKGRGFILIFPTQLSELALGAGICAVFCLLVYFAKHRAREGVKANQPVKS